MSYSIGHTLVTPLPDGRVSYTPCRRCGEGCRGHTVTRLRDIPQPPTHMSCGHLVAEIAWREGGTRWCAGCEREARLREEAVEAAAQVAEDACDDPPWAIAERIRALAGDRPR